MNDILNGLSSWRENKNVDNKEFVLDVEVSNLLEECSEFLRADNDNDRIDALCDISVFSINALKYLDRTDIQIYNSFNRYDYNIFDVIVNIGTMNNKNNNDLISTIDEIVTYCFVITTQLKYDYKKCMLETIKEISSREQCPIQARKWKENGISGKWQKNKNQDKSTLYKADYDKCKLKD